MTLNDLRPDTQARGERLDNLLTRLQAKCERCRSDWQLGRFGAAYEILSGKRISAFDHDKLRATAGSASFRQMTILLRHKAWVSADMDGSDQSTARRFSESVDRNNSIDPDDESIAHAPAEEGFENNQSGNKIEVLWGRLREHPLAHIGPGLISGAADDDPSGIATYSQAGARFGLDMLWTMPVAFPLMAAMQSMCARIGRVTGKGLATNIKAIFPPIILKIVVSLLLVANVCNIAADIAAMGEAAELVSGINRHLITAIAVVITLFLQVFLPYHRYVHVLKWLTVSLLAYAAVVFTVHVPWAEVARRTVFPTFRFSASTAAMIVALFGTTISPYLFFWQASEEVEDMRVRRGSLPLINDAPSASRELRRIRWDTWAGMLYSDITSFFIILATAVTLHAAGTTNIETAAQAASTLRPFAGNLAGMLFALGILGAGLIGVPVLAGSGAYALSETLGWNSGLELRAADAPGFYGVIAVSVLLGLGLQYSPISPMQALLWSSVVNGIVAVPLMVVIILLATNKSLMGPYTASRSIAFLGWIATSIMGAAVLALFLPF